MGYQTARKAPPASDAQVSAEDIRSALELQIVLGRRQPRERLVEDELMREFGAKRHVIRSALADLEMAGLVVRPPNRGARVREFTRAEVEALYDFRMELHAAAVARMPLPLADETLSELDRIVSAHETAVAQGDLAAVIRENDRFHDTLFGQCGNPFLAETIRRMDLAANAIRSYRIGNPEMLRLAMQEHRRMLEAAREGDRDLLIRLCRDHIVPSRDLYLRERGAREVPAG